MTTVTMTKRGNIRVDGVKFYAVHHQRTEDHCDCPLSRDVAACTTTKCRPDERPAGYRLANKSVAFISKERYDAVKAAKEKGE